MHYKVTSQYPGGREMPSESFKDIPSAKAFIEAKMRENINLKIKVIYRLYEWDDLLEEFDSEKAAFNQSTSGSSDSSGGRGKGASFRPTPLNTTARPPGSPPNWLKDDDEEEGKK